MLAVICFDESTKGFMNEEVENSIGTLGATQSRLGGHLALEDIEKLIEEKPLPLIHSLSVAMRKR